MGAPPSFLQSDLASVRLAPRSINSLGKPISIARGGPPRPRPQRVRQAAPIRSTEIDQQQRPDLRVENQKTPAVSIEAKWADNWTLNDLLVGLEAQLVGQYLRAHDSRHGVYFLATDGRKKQWEGRGGIRLTFEDVTAKLKALASEIEAENPGVDAVRVVTIDFRPPSKR